MTVTEPFELAAMILKNPIETFAKFREKPPFWMAISLYFIIWAGTASYIFSYLSAENDAEKIKQYLTFAFTGLGGLLAAFFFFSLILYGNARIVFGHGGFQAIFTACFYSFLAVALYLALPVQLLSFLFIPPEAEYWFSIITRSVIISYYLLLLIIATGKIFELSVVRSVISVFAVFAYAIFFVISAIYIARTCSIPLF